MQLVLVSWFSYLQLWLVSLFICLPISRHHGLAEGICRESRKSLKPTWSWGSKCFEYKTTQVRKPVLLIDIMVDTSLRTILDQHSSLLLKSFPINLCENKIVWKKKSNSHSIDTSVLNFTFTLFPFSGKRDLFNFVDDHQEG